MSLPLETLTTEQKLGIRATLGLGTADSPAFAGATIGSGTFAVNGVSFGRGGGSIATNTAVGAGCLAVNSTGIECVAVGSTSLAANTVGSRNVALGTASLNKNTSGNDNCSGGVFALFSNLTGSENVAFGNRALIASTGANNTAIGHQSLTEIAAGNLNVGAGWRAGRYIADGVTANTNSQSSCFIGANTRPLAISQSNQIVIGHDAIGAGSNSATLGNDAVTLTSLKGNVVVHRTSDITNFERVGMRWDGFDAKIGTSKGDTGVARDLVFETDGTERARISAVGVFSVDGVRVWRGAGGSSTTTAVGSAALISNTGVDSSAFGNQSLFSNTSGSANSGFGRNSLFLNANGTGNSAFGASSLANNITGSNNSAFGLSAGRFIADGTTVAATTANSCFFGVLAKPLADNQTNQIVIGFNATGLGSNSAVIGNDSVTLTVLKGNTVVPRTSDLTNFERVGMRWDGLDAKIGTSRGGTGGPRDLALETGGTERARILGTNGNLGLGTATPTQRLDVVGSIKASQPIIFPSYTVATVPVSASYIGGMVYISDEAGGPTMAFYDGANWRRVQDRAIISLAA